MGAPYEGRRELMDIKGFSTPKGTVLPNDDLDLQLAWLLAMEENGPYNLNALILGEYWINYITAPLERIWNWQMQHESGTPAAAIGRIQK